MNVVELFLQAAVRHPERVAIVERTQSVTYAELAERVRDTAARYHRRGVRPGDRVLVFVPMSVRLYQSVLALFYLGATAVFLDEWVSRERMARCCRLADCQAFIGTPKARMFAWFSKTLRRIPLHLSPGGRVRGGAVLPVQAVTADTTALITFTTGSTGTPKAADRTHGFLRAQFDALVDEIRPTPTDVDMPVLPIVLLVNLGIGCTSVIADYPATRPERMQPARVAEQLRTNGVERVIASPYFVRRLAEYALEQRVAFPQLRQVFTGGAPVFPREAAQYRRAFPEAEIRIVYGSTEAEPISSILAGALPDTLPGGLPVGMPFHGAAVRIIGYTSEAVPALSAAELESRCHPDGEIGEILVSGRHVLRRYFRNEKALRHQKIVTDDTVWHRTGDSGFLRDGQLYLTGRCAQLIRRAGGYLAPFLIEQQLLELPGVTCGTLLELEESLVLVLETADGKDVPLPALTDLPYDRLVFQSRIPRDPRHHSKIDYGALRRQLD